MEDRVLLDAAGLLTPVESVGAESAVDAASANVAVMDSPVAVQPTVTDASAATVEGQIAANFDSVVRRVDKTLIFSDVAVARDNQWVISIVGGQLQIQDQAGFTLGTQIAGATGSGSNTLTIPLASLQGVDEFFIDTGGGKNSVTFDLSQHADMLLGQFENIRVEANPSVDASSNLTVAFIGDPTTDLKFLAPVNRNQPAQIEVLRANQQTTFYIDANSTVDVTGMHRADFVRSGSGPQQLKVYEGRDSTTQQHDALVAQFLVPRWGERTVQFYNNQTVSLTVDSATTTSSQITVSGAANHHQNGNLILDVGSVNDGRPRSVIIDGPVALAGKLTIRTGTLKVESPVQAVGDIDILAVGTVTLEGSGGLQGSAITVTSTGASIRGSAAGGVVLTGQQLSLTAATGIGTQQQPLRTQAGSLMATVTGSGGIFVDESDAVILTGVSSINGPVQITAGGPLTVSNATSVAAAGAIQLQAQGGPLRVLGTIRTTDGDIDLTSTGNVTLAASSQLETIRGTITLRADIANQGTGDIRVAGSINNDLGTTVFWVPNSSSQFTGQITGDGTVIKQGPGILTIDATGKWAHGGATLIQQGTLVVDGSITMSSQLTLADFTTLQGGGQIKCARVLEPSHRPHHFNG